MFQFSIATQSGSRRSFRHRWFRQLTTLLMWFAAAMALQLVCSQAANADQTSRPNIVLIMADDMGFECVTANGGQTYQTPNLDRLAAEGMRFENCYSQPICTPSRVQLMTGLYNSRNYVQFGLLKPGSYTFGNALRDAGYATCIVGKWQLQGGFEGPHEFGFDEYCLWQLTRRPNRYPNPGLEINGKEVDYKNGEYGPDIVSDYACDFIDRQAKSDKPFFLYYPMMLPHWPFEPTPASKEWDPTARRDDTTEKGNGQKSVEFFDDMVNYVDRIVGKLTTKLNERGLAENTLVLFTGDNGTFSGITSKFKGRDWKGGKGHMMDNGTHVTLIAHWPGTIAAGKVNHDLIDFSDMLPTVADAATAKLPASIPFDGRSFLPQLQGKQGQPRDWVYCWYFRNGSPAAGGDNHSAGESARTMRYKLYLDGGFFDVENDFYERSPLDPTQLSAEQQQVRQQLDQVLQQNTRAGFYEKKKGK